VYRHLKNNYKVLLWHGYCNIVLDTKRIKFFIHFSSSEFAISNRAASLDLDGSLSRWLIDKIVF
jgi:hypothetical protein